MALTIAGFDPGSGAGATADLKTFAAHQVYGVACLSALTVQSTQGVRAVQPLGGAWVRETLECLAADVPIAGVKIGMLGSAEVVDAVCDWLRGFGERRPVTVLDPVLRASSGAALLEEAGRETGVERMRSDLLAVVDWVTPNLAELAVLSGMPVAGRADIPEAARRLRQWAAERGNTAFGIVVTGGHLDPPDDYLLAPDGTEVWLPGEAVATEATHGTGCAFASALLCELMAGRAPEQAARRAKAYVTEALRSAYPIGQGKGPMNHLFNR